MSRSDSSGVPDRNAVFGNYQILEKIAEGGMGSVYRARQTSLNRVVALKILSPQLSADASYVESFRRESQAAANLRHPNLVTVHDAGEVDGLQYYAMEFVEGETLQRWLQRHGALDERAAIEVAMCVASALQYAWDKGRLIHRDIKPENIIIDPEGRVKLCDMGLAKTFGEETLLTLSGLALGTPHYVSPEQARGDTQLDQRSDIYSLGMTLYNMVSGRLPFDGPTAAVVMAKHLTEQLPDPREAVPSVSLGMCRLLEKMLAKQPHDRYQTWDEVLRDMQRVYDGQLPLAEPPSGISSLKLRPEVDRRTTTVGVRRGFHPERPAVLREVAAVPGKMRWPAVAALVVLVLLAIFAALVLTDLVSVESVPFLSRLQTVQSPAPSVLESTEAARQLKQVIEFAAANDQKYEEILARLEKIKQQFQSTKEAVQAQRLIETILRKQLEAAQAPAVEALKEAKAFAEANPQRRAEIVERFQRVADQYPQTQAAEVAAQLAKQWLDAQAEDEQKQQQEEEAQLAEQKRRDEAAHLQARPKAEEEAARTQAELRFIDFGRAFLGALGRREYAAAASLARDAAEDPALSPLKERLASCQEIGQRLEAFWKSLPQQIARLKGQKVVLKDIRGVLIDVHGGQLGVEVGEDREVSVPLKDLQFEDWLQLASLVPELHNAEGWLTLAAFCLGEGQSEKARGCLGRARVSSGGGGVAATIEFFLTDYPMLSEAHAALTELRSLVDKQHWSAARVRLGQFLLRYQQTVVARAAAAELRQIEERITAFEQQNAESAAQRLVLEVKTAARLRQWKQAGELLRYLNTTFRDTKAFKSEAVELGMISQAVADAMEGRAELVFHGTNAQGVVAKDAVFDPGKGDFSVVIFFKSMTPQSQHYVLVQNGLVGMAPVWSLAVGVMGSRFQVGGVQAVFPHANPFDGLWHCQAMTRKDGVVRAYFDGKEIGSFKAAGTAGSPSNLLFSLSPSATFVASLKKASYWSRALSAAEVEAIARGAIALSGGEAGLIAYWPMDDGSGNTFREAVANRNGMVRGDYRWEGGGSGVDSLVAHWRFDETRGFTARDSGPNRFDAVLKHYADTDEAWVVGHLGNALSFNGRSHYVSVPNSEQALNPGKRDWTICAWVKTSGTMRRGVGRDYYQVVVSKNDGRGRDLVLGIGVTDNPGRAIFSVSGAGPGMSVVGKTDVSDGRWHHLVGTRAGKTLKLYVDGQLEAQLTDHNIPEDIFSDAPLQIGRYGLWEGWTTPRFEGLIDDVRIYSRALSAAELAVMVRRRQ